MDKEPKNPFYEQIKQYIGQDVKVVMKNGKELKGILASINFTTANFCLTNKTAHYIIRDDYSYIEIPIK